MLLCDIQWLTFKRFVVRQHMLGPHITALDQRPGGLDILDIKCGAKTNPRHHCGLDIGSAENQGCACGNPMCCGLVDTHQQMGFNVTFVAITLISDVMPSSNSLQYGNSLAINQLRGHFRVRIWPRMQVGKRNRNGMPEAAIVDHVAVDISLAARRLKVLSNTLH